MSEARIGRTSIRVLVKPTDSSDRVGRASARTLLKPDALPLRVGRTDSRVLLRRNDLPLRVGRLTVRTIVSNSDVQSSTAVRSGWGVVAVANKYASYEEGLYKTEAIDNLTTPQTINLLLPAGAEENDMAIVMTGHRSQPGVPNGFTLRASSTGGQSTSNSQVTRVSTKNLTATDIANGYITLDVVSATSYGFVYSIQLLRSTLPAYTVTFDVASAGPTTNNGTSKTTPALVFGGIGRYVFHQASFFQNSGVDSGVWNYPYALDQSFARVNREIGGICRAPFDEFAVSSPAVTWSISGTTAGGLGTTAVAVYLA